MSKEKKRPDFHYEDLLNGLACGIDEAGRGPLAGPVVASAVIIPHEIRDMDFIAELNDSKKLSKKKRALLYDLIQEHCHVGVGIVSPQEIDKINILQATFKAMKLATLDLDIKPEWLLIDGSQAPLAKNYKIKTLVKGDSLSCSIAAASIIAKQTRDKIMHDLAKIEPEFGWDTNSGYGTKKHIEAIHTSGISKHHRISFEPIKSKVLDENL